MMHTHRWPAIAILCVMGAAAGCSSGDASSRDSSTVATSTGPGSTTAPGDSTAQPDGSATPGDTAAMCDAFRQIATGAASTSNGAEPTTKEGWDLKLEWTKRFVDGAPPEWQSVAQTYLGIVEDRAGLLAQYGYPLITDLPPDVRSAFIADHTAAQNEANTFIAFAKQSCGVS
jgi:hypothetical protein